MPTDILFVKNKIMDNAFFRIFSISFSCANDMQTSNSKEYDAFKGHKNSHYDKTCTNAERQHWLQLQTFDVLQLSSSGTNVVLRTINELVQTFVRPPTHIDWYRRFATFTPDLRSASEIGFGRSLVRIEPAINQLCSNMPVHIHTVKRLKWVIRVQPSRIRIRRNVWSWRTYRTCDSAEEEANQTAYCCLIFFCSVLRGRLNIDLDYCTHRNLLWTRCDFAMHVH